MIAMCVIFPARGRNIFPHWNWGVGLSILRYGNLGGFLQILEKPEHVRQWACCLPQMCCDLLPQRRNCGIRVTDALVRAVQGSM